MLYFHLECHTKVLVRFPMSKLTNWKKEEKMSFPFVFLSFFCNFAIKDGELTWSRHKKD